MKDLITVATKKLESELVEPREELKKNEIPNTNGEKVESKAAKSVEKKVIECRLKDYCKYPTKISILTEIVYQVSYSMGSE